MSFYFSAINLGCNKNLVDLECVIGKILSLGASYDVQFFEDPDAGDVEYLIINTCGFLSSSREESEEFIQYYDSLGKKLILMGCYLPVKNDSFLNSLQNLYAVVPFHNYVFIEELITGKKSKSINFLELTKIQNVLKEAKGQKNLENYLQNLSKKEAFVWKGDEVRAYFNAPYSYEYLKISEGCDNTCTFCIIPKIRGMQKSRKKEDIVTEVKLMVQNGIKEICIISQNTPMYGSDIYGEPILFDLLDEIDTISGDFEIRLFYMYPDILDEKSIKRLKKLKKFIPYFDIPFQHISPKILKKMGRFYDENHIVNLIESIRKNFNKSFIHTNFIVGFPGEEDEDFEKLICFVKKYAFESMSVFEYHDEPLSASFHLDKKVPYKIAGQRLKQLKKVINEVYTNNFEARKGKIFTGYIMGFDEDNILIRERFQAPEIDEYDRVKEQNIISGKREIGERVEYKL
ncbi:MiaB/RimO family radical SAM methylthiotransferase [Candidatus Gracilibacteria bacterium]|nr:MiaB/RimO family radical SAM methylthiotransferase [Candidatus Gracilibacteria bacterium]NUJ99204.1 MiaB/RimO family radical SAM methylthiotransferase [Candidatus Gracilibacteria bacterium]